MKDIWSAVHILFVSFFSKITFGWYY